MNTKDQSATSECYQKLSDDWYKVSLQKHISKPMVSQLVKIIIVSQLLIEYI